MKSAAPAPSRFPNQQWSAWSRRLAISFAAVTAAFSLFEGMEWPFLRWPLELAMRYALEREVTIGADFGVRFVGQLRLRTNILIVGPAPEGPALYGQKPELLRAAGLHLAVPYTTLLTFSGKGNNENEDPASIKRPHISTLEASRLDATLVRSEDGRANWRFGPQDEKKPSALPQFGHLAIAAGDIRLDDAFARVRLEATLHSLEDSSSSAPGPGKAEKARLEISARGDYRGQNLSARLRAGGPLALVDSTAQTKPVSLQLELRMGATALDFDGTVRDVLQLGGLDGHYRLVGPSLAMIGDAIGVTLPTTDTFAMRGRVVKDGAIWFTDIRELSIGTSRLNGSFHYNPTLNLPKLTGRLNGVRLSMPDLGPTIGTSPRPPSGRMADAKTSSTSSRPTRVLPQREFDIPSLAGMDADVTVDLAQFDLGTAQLEALAPFQAHIRLKDRVLTLGNIVARTAEGDLLGSLSLDARSETPVWNADLRWSGVQLERFVKPRNVADRSAAHGYIGGTLSGRAVLRGDGRSTARMLSSLDGDMQFWVHDGQISHFLVEVMGIDIAEALGMLVRGDEPLPMQCAISALKVHRGNAQVMAAVIETRDTTVNGTGAISLADERLGLVFRAQPKDLSPVALRAPLHIEGTFASPKVRLETAPIGMRLAAAATLAMVTPIAALLALLDLGDEEKQACQKAFDRIQRSSRLPASAPQRAR